MSIPTAPSNRRASWTLVIGIVLAVLFAAIGWHAEPRTGTSGLVGKPASAFSLPLLGDLPNAPNRSPEASRGKVLLLHFWAPSCQPCLAEMPQWQALHAESRRPDAGFDVLTVSGDDTQEVRAFLRNNAYSFEVIHDGNARVHRDYRVTGIPHTYAIAPDGRVAVELSGPQSAEALHDAIAAARVFR
ncbi:MAG: TlpA family protein disulfide reductase [Myxococcota bacterium]